MTIAFTTFFSMLSMFMNLERAYTFKENEELPKGTFTLKIKYLCSFVNF